MFRLRPSSWLLMFLLAAVGAGLARGLAAVEPQAFFPELPSAYALSPSGRWLAFLLSDGDHVRVYTRDIQTGRGFQLNGYAGAPDQIVWIDDERLVLRTRVGSYTKLFQTDPEGATFWDFTPRDNCIVALLDDQPPATNSGRLYFTFLRTDGTTALYALQTRRGVGGRFPIFRISRNPRQISEWLFRPDGAIAGGIAAEKTDRVLWVPKNEEDFADEWAEAHRAPAEEFPRFTASGCAPGRLLASGYFGGERLSAREFDLETRRFGAVALETDAGHIQEVFFSPDRREIAGHLLYDTRPPLIARSTGFRRFVSQLERQLGPADGRALLPAAITQNYEAALVLEDSEQAPPTLWHVDLARKQSFAFFVPPVGPDFPKLRPMEPWSVQARDGLALPCFRVAPPGHTPAARVVLFVGGGPFEGLHRGWAPLLQFLSANGAKVVAMNYRGATGFGRAFHDAGVGQGAAAMVDDVEDVIAGITHSEWARGLPLDVVAFSFGGFLTLRASENAGDAMRSLSLINPLLDPERFFERAAADGAPAELVSYQRDRWFGAARVTRSQVESAIPPALPLLLIQSALDERVSPSLAREFTSKLRRRDGTAEYLELPDTHFIARSDTWQRIARRLREPPAPRGATSRSLEDLTRETGR